MGEEIAISLKNISKCFKCYIHPVDRLKEIFLSGKSRASEFWALRDINLEIPKGETVGIIGKNGSGKSTLLQIIAGTLTPTTGEVIVNGRVSALLELGSGFNPEFTGRQNVFFNGRLLGLNQKQIEDKFDAIASFADIGDFIDQPVKTYSSGMFVRLAFAVAVNVDPEILIVDEALAVGDIVFQHRCMRRMRSLMDSGVTTLFVSHDSGAVKTLCNSAVMIHEGQNYFSGTPNAVIIKYMKLVTETELGIGTKKEENSSHNQHHSQQSLVKSQPTRRGNRKALIKNIQLLNKIGEKLGETPTIGFNEQVKLIVELDVYETLKACIVGFFICDKNGNELVGSNTFEENYPIDKLEPGEQLKIEFIFHLPLRPGSYSLTVAGAENYTAMTFDWIDNAMVFQVLPPDTGKRIHAWVDLPISVQVEVSPQKLPMIK
ncbi:MAG: ABC transporter ATP-binding protein [Pelatocladus maniniholoensis HA4357-MV3]|jgi:lipopolysaccharide transport system ATP-binding protein|uniref:ABC transporter ATP-binding protein n=1 Tax=Pelatocladus maniniholoensis HA4357-MV3 TaxID=1117104 RepID=A0A9E3HA97_9NOST|nr:ABC transporter ATP-binding protein [Pelatocladus maniniholoensis HA4357-MV3]BAZ68734.1 ABC transporter-related protein [Fischerella sp. NIES-4106]